MTAANDHDIARDRPGDHSGTISANPTDRGTARRTAIATTAIATTGRTTRALAVTRTGYATGAPQP
jgi:hypothetical protein